MRSLILPALLVTATAGVACSSDDDDDDDVTTLTAVTYNLGLAPGFVPAADSRTDLASAAAVALDSDVLCVQEVWLPSQRAVLEQEAMAYPSQIYVEADAGEVGSAACTDADLQPLLDCSINAGCDQVCVDQLVTCVLDACLPEFQALPPDCNSCLQANVGNTLSDIESTCESQSTEFAFGGSFGLGLLSKYPFLEKNIITFQSTTNRRAAIYALLDTPLGPVHTYCTHLTAVFDDIPYPRDEGSWEEEQATQVAELIADIDNRSGADGQVLVLGDTNNGPAGPGYGAEAPQNYEPFPAAGLVNPYTDTPGHTCTFCSDNPLIGNDDDESVVIDHVFVRNISGSTSAARVLDGAVDVETCGETSSSALSDHYGVSVTISRETDS
ncbi:MAG: endonuclease/exonuclease/phosphatase family protein [Myxococcota bacterium]